MSAETLRLLPVALAVSAVPLLYGFVRHLCGEKAGLLAALCLALSPQHIWYAQELRPYELVTPLAVISVWSFMRAYRGGSPVWWVVNLISNTLLGLSKLDLGGCGWRPSTQLLEGLAQEAQAKMPDFSAQVCYSLPAEGCCLPDATACQPGGLLLT